MEEMAILREAESDNEWLQRNFEEIQEEHPNRFVAISKGRLITEGKTSDDVVRAVEKKGLDPAVTLVEFIPQKGMSLIL